MQRSRFNLYHFIQLSALFVVALVYNAISSQLLWLPPLYSIYFFLFIKALDTRNMAQVLFLFIFLFFIEANAGYTPFSLSLFIIILYRFILPLQRRFITCQPCRILLFELESYIGLYLYMLLLHKFFWVEYVHISFNVLFYMIIELFILMLLNRVHK